MLFNYVKEMNRKRIAMVKDNLLKLSNENKTKILKYTKQYCPELEFRNGKFTISNEKQLKELLYGLEERYYTTEVGNEKRFANSVMKIS